MPRDSPRDGSDDAYPSRAAIRSIACPVTVIEGELSDRAFVTADAFVMRLLPQARMVLLPGAAHMLHVDQPELWVEAVAEPTARMPSPAAAPISQAQQSDDGRGVESPDELKEAPCTRG